MATKHKSIGSDFDDFLAEEGILAEVDAAAIKRVVAFEIEKEMKARRLTKKAMAAAMCTSRPALDRLLDPNNDSVTLRTLDRAARALGRRLDVHLV